HPETPAAAQRGCVVDFDHIAPHDLEAEESVLGACLVDLGAIATVGAIVSAADFLLERHRVAFAAMLRLAQRGEPVTPVLLGHEIGEQLEAVGGYSWLASLTTELPTAIGAEFYA